MARDLTAANSVIMLSVAGLFSIPQQLQGFAADNIFDVDPVPTAETVMGVDGILSGGWIPAERKMMISIQADSASNDFFDAWATNQQASRGLFIATGNVTLPAVGMTFACIRGFLTTYSAFPNPHKILQPRRYAITWGSVLPAPIPTLG